ncbi:hypothetical protein COV11_02695 [Candidatus Woesearchaeota archaeon CG10_big_fil_rev_8_21_14_0_10_30_7]|nr:MAG: hypothetical protein COV11_02695 [Candidatus Woesearchaeota archaeon CG10_big_fil_rev_8_21_14_0_10_30_7]
MKKIDRFKSDCVFNKKNMTQNQPYSLSFLTNKMLGLDSAAIVRAKLLELPIDDLCRQIEHDNKRLDDLRKSLNQILNSTAQLDYVRTLPHTYNLLASSLDFIQAYKSSILKYASVFTTELRLIKNTYCDSVRGKISVSTLEKVKQTNPGDEFLFSDSVANSAFAVATLNDLGLRITSIYSKMNKEYAITVETVSKSILDFNKYLKERFVKPEEQKKKKEAIMGLFMREELPSITEYVKIKLVKDSPVLTDVLLEMIDELPILKEREVKKGRKKIRVKEVSKYDMELAADKLIAISNPTLMNYYENPQTFFADIGCILKETNYYLSQLTDCVQKLLEVPNNNTILNLSEIDEILNLSEQNNQSLVRNTKKIANADIESIVQDEDELLPENRKETDYFKLREKLLDLLYTSMKQLSRNHLRTRKDEEIASKTIAKAVELKSEMEELIKPANARKLRKDKQTDNEFYVGKQGDIGSFFFERAPTPNVKMDDVKGKSFSDVKQHLNEIIETASFPHIMRLSAPGGKVRSNILMIGPYGCGKTEIARAVCGDKRVIGATVSVAGTLTAYMHESVNNVKRIYDQAKQLFTEGRELKPVVLTLDEFDGWFAKSDYGHSGKDMEQIENILLEVLDGMGDYNGIITVGMTNKPWKIPHGILRRFRYVDIVGQLNQEESADLLKMFLEKSFPVSSEITLEQYLDWAETLKDAPGDVIRKVVDELHFKFLPDYLKSNPKEAQAIQKNLQKREQKKGTNDDEDIAFLKEKLSKHITIMPEHVTNAIKKLLIKPSIRMQINDAKTLYEKTGELLSRLEKGDSGLMGMKSRDTVFEMDESDY